MPETGASQPEVQNRRIVIWPALLTLAVTLVRLAGELTGGPSWLFSSKAGGGFALVGIVWLVPLCGIYFARRLAIEGRGPKSETLALQVPLLGWMFVVVTFLGAGRIPISNPYFQVGLFLWLPMAIAAACQFLAWPVLARTLLVYAFAARIPVAIIMLIAMLGNWGTHYDAVPDGFPVVSFAFKFLWFGLLPQLIFWVGFTVLAGMLAGSLALVLWKSKSAAPADDWMG